MREFEKVYLRLREREREIEKEKEREREFVQNKTKELVTKRECCTQ